MGSHIQQGKYRCKHAILVLTFFFAAVKQPARRLGVHYEFLQNSI